MTQSMKLSLLCILCNIIDIVNKIAYYLYMTNKNKAPATPASRLAKTMAEQGLRIFTRSQAIVAALDLGYSDSYAKDIIFQLQKAGWIERLRPGLYALNSIFLGGHPIHEFEILSHLAQGTVVSHFSAMHHYGFTDQIPHTLYGTVKTGATLPRSNKEQPLLIQGNEYHFTQTAEQQFFGHKKIWVGEARILITDPERTLLDGLIKPSCCGGFQEVLNAFISNINDVNIATLTSYALRLDKSTSKRLGWILDQLETDEVTLKSLLEVSFKGYAPLDASGEKTGPYNKKWQIQENL